MKEYAVKDGNTVVSTEIFQAGDRQHVLTRTFDFRARKVATALPFTTPQAPVYTVVKPAGLFTDEVVSVRHLPDLHGTLMSVDSFSGFKDQQELARVQAMVKRAPGA